MVINKVQDTYYVTHTDPDFSKYCSELEPEYVRTWYGYPN